jgi:MFS family permease
VAIAMALVLGLGGSVALIFVLAALDAVAASLFWPAHTALIPELGRSAEELTAANAVSSAMEALGTLIGPGFAAVGLAIWEPAAVFVLAAAAFGLALVAATRLTSDRLVRRRKTLGARAEIVAGIRFAVGHEKVRLVVGLWTVESFVIGMTEVFVVLVAIELTGLGDPGVGLLNAIVGLGGLVGAVALSAVGRRYPFGKILGLSLAGFGLVLITPGVWPTAVVAVLVFAVVGFAESYVDVASQTLLQRLVPETYLARVLGAFEGLYWGSLGLGAVAASSLTVWFGVRPALIITGVGLAGLAVLARSGLRRIDAELDVPIEEVELFEGVPGFAMLPVPTLEHLARNAAKVDVAAGTTIIRTGDAGDCFYVVAAGLVEVVVHGSEVTTIGPGGFFGEIALLYDQPRMADVVAREATSLRSLERDIFVTAVTGHMRSETAMSTVMVARLAESGRYRRHGPAG